jgi:hypothetical protein
VIVLAVEGSQLGIEVHADAGEDAAQGVLIAFVKTARRRSR